jgi:hypothetical protein
MATLTVGHRISFSGGTYQNYNIGSGSFLPFGFSGTTANRSGDNTSAALTFPNNALARRWMDELVETNAVVTVEELANGSVVYRYVGQVTSGGFDDTTVNLQLSNVLDAVTTDVPWRYLTEELVGPIPMSASVRVS